MVNEIKHTPGPWHTGRNTVVRNTIVYDKDGCAICDCKIFHAEHGPDEMSANAKLIAAAPELLEECKAQASLIRALWSFMKTEENEHQIKLIMSRLKASESLITKATGQ